MGNDLVERRIAYCLKQAEAEASVLTMWNEKEYPNSPQKPVLIEQTQAYITAKMLKSQAARIEALEGAIKPFAEAFEKARISYSERYAAGGYQEVGLENFDKMPDKWPMEKLQFNMGTFRRAARAYANKGEPT